MLSSTEAEPEQPMLGVAEGSGVISLFDADNRNFYALLDSQGVYLDVNARFAQHFACDKTKVIGSHLSGFFTELSNGLTVAEVIERFSSSQVVRSELVLSEDNVWIDLTCLPITLNDGSVGCVLTGHDISGQKEVERNLRELAHLDPLTQLPNLRFIDYQLRKLQSLGMREGHGFTVVFIDFDQFKAINDVHGHLGGDQVLIEFSRRLRAKLRGGEHVGRIGGDEFLVVIREALCEKNRESLSQRLKAVVESPFDIGNGAQVNLGISVGIAVWPIDGDSLVELKQLADSRMYADKHQL